jgi:hypothetical protein
MYPNKFFNRKACRKASCGKEFLPTAPSHLYCSKECRGKNSYYLRNYSMTQDDLETLKESQGGACFLCSSEGFVMSPNGVEKLVVDHDHDTGEVRKLLCHNCNRGLGLFKDNPDLLRRAAAYVEDHREGATTIPKGSTLK